MIDDFLAVHADSLRLRSQRTKILASNIANADTPNYKAKDLAFAEVLKDAGATAGATQRRLSLAGSQGNSSGLSTTDSRHIVGRFSSGSSAAVMYRLPQEASLDGNTVDKDLEQARFAENTIRYQASLEFINSRISGLIRTLRSE